MWECRFQVDYIIYIIDGIESRYKKTKHLKKKLQKIILGMLIKNTIVIVSILLLTKVYVQTTG